MKIQLYNKIKNTAGGFHSWFNSNVGRIRKPNMEVEFEKVIEVENKQEKPSLSWWQKVGEYIKGLISKLWKTLVKNQD